MPIGEVNRSATTTAAKVIGMENRLVLVKKDYVADLIVDGQNPLLELATLHSPILVIQGGKKS